MKYVTIIATALLCGAAFGQTEPVDVKVGDEIELTAIPEPYADADIEVVYEWDETVFSGPESPPYTSGEPLVLEAVGPSDGPVEVVGTSATAFVDGNEVEIGEIVQAPGMDVEYRPINIRIEVEVIVSE